MNLGAGGTPFNLEEEVKKQNYSAFMKITPPDCPQCRSAAVARESGLGGRPCARPARAGGGRPAMAGPRLQPRPVSAGE